MSRGLLAAGVSTLLLLAVARSSLASGGISSRHLRCPPISQAVHSALNLGVYFMPDVPVSPLEWDLELEYDIADSRAVYQHYDQASMRLGFSRSSYEADDEIEARYTWAGIEAALEVESQNGRTKVELELADSASTKG